MRRIGNSGIRFFIPLITILFCFTNDLSAQADQDFRVEATVSENKIFVGEQFTLSVEVTGSSMRDVSLPELPEIPGTRILSDTPSRSTSISIVNGQTTTSISYSYALIARDRGNHTIPPVKLTVGDTEYETEPISIEILERGQTAQDGSRQLPDIYLELELNSSRPVTGQQIVASVVLYFKQGVEVSSFQPASGWRTDGFWKEELENISQPQAETVILNGVRYRSATLMRYALFPTRSGELSLSEFTMNVSVRTQPSRNDPFGSFFGSGANQRRVTLESEPITMNVRPVPDASNAITMNAVGNMRVERKLSANEIITGETIELETTVTGSGNIPLVRKPEYSLPDGLEMYTPQETSNIQRQGLTIRGSKVFTELIAPRAPGQYRIPAARVAVYNPSAGRYQTISLPALSFEALPDNQITESSRSAQPYTLQPITGLASWSNGSKTSPFSTVWFWVLLILPAAAVIAALQKKTMVTRLMSDKEFARAHFADQTAKERCDYARSLVDSRETKEIYNTLHKAITGFITDKLQLPEAGLSDNEIIQKLNENSMDQSLIRQVQQILNKCATISYAPTGSTSDFRNDIIRTEKLIDELKEEFS